jgi:hypothetical protein
MMSAGPRVHINLCCDITSKSGRETLSKGRACSILALGGCVAQTLESYLVDPTRATRQLDSTNAKTSRKVPAPDPNTTSVIAPRAPKTTLINAATAGLGNGKTMTVGDDKPTKRL